MKHQSIYILAIESSCDDTSAAVLQDKKVLSNVVATQKIHEEYGGVVPELASRAHQQNIVPVVHQALVKANIDKKVVSAIAFTRGPGLMGSLLVGTSFAKSLALGLGVPLIEVNHMQAHILAHFIEDGDEGGRVGVGGDGDEDGGGKKGDGESKSGVEDEGNDEEVDGGEDKGGVEDEGRGEDESAGKDKVGGENEGSVVDKAGGENEGDVEDKGGAGDKGGGEGDVENEVSGEDKGGNGRIGKDHAFSTPEFPFLALTISGGHTQIVLVKDFFDMEILGETLDDAVGEAFDKSAKILGLPYPGGPLVDQYAQEGNPDAYPFPKPKVDGLNFSFSGLKTSILYFVQRETAKNPDFTKDNLKDICASIQKTIIGILMDKLKKASKQTGITRIAIGGGVSANSGIRTSLKQAEKKLGWTTYIPKFEYCTDNAAMIGIVGYLKYQTEEFAEQGVTAKARYAIS